MEEDMKQMFTAVILATLPAMAAAEPVIVPSEGSVRETVERLQDSIETAGARVFGVVDFGGGIRSIGEDVGEVQLVIFGDPHIGAEALSADRMAALDLPGKVLVYDTPEGSAMAYQQPAEMLAKWDIPADDPLLDAISRTLGTITADAAR
jgi:uncharacterized protein (DUF302 family)